MKDRIPRYAGRVRMTPVSGQQNVYTMERADQPTQEGTPINKATLLKDATAQLYGLTSSAVPDDVLVAIANQKAQIFKGVYTGSGTYGESNKNSLMIPFEPRIVIIAEDNATLGGMISPYFYPQTYFVTTTYYPQTASDYRACTVDFSGQWMYWYSSDSAAQLNKSGKTYYYTIIG